MRCGLDGTDCALEHTVPALGGRCTKSRKTGSRTTPYEWAACCPLCGGTDKLTLTAKGPAILRHCQRCKASQDDLTAALAKVLPGCFGVRKTSARITTDALLGLAGRDLPASAYRIELLRMAGMSAQDARRHLGLPDRTYYDAMRALGTR